MSQRGGSRCFALELAKPSKACVFIFLDRTGLESSEFLRYGYTELLVFGPDKIEARHLLSRTFIKIKKTQNLQ